MIALRVVPWTLALGATLLVRRDTAWRTVALQLVGLGLLSVGVTHGVPRLHAAAVALWPGVALAGVLGALDPPGTGPLRQHLVELARRLTQHARKFLWRMRRPTRPVDLVEHDDWGEVSVERSTVSVIHPWTLPPWLAVVALYTLAAAACAALYTRELWWIGEGLEVALRVAVGPTLTWAWTRRHGRLTPAQVAALAPAVEVAFAPFGPWARWLAGHVAVVEDWPLGLAGSAAAYTVVAAAMLVERRRCE